jgi:hypothetical protein
MTTRTRLFNHPRATTTPDVPGRKHPSQEPDGGTHPILCGEVWRRCFASLAVNATPIRNEAAKLFTSSYDNFIQTASIRDGASHCDKILTCFLITDYLRSSEAFEGDPWSSMID